MNQHIGEIWIKDFFYKGGSLQRRYLLLREDRIYSNASVWKTLELDTGIGKEVIFSSDSNHSWSKI